MELFIYKIVDKYGKLLQQGQLQQISGQFIFLFEDKKINIYDSDFFKANELILETKRVVLNYDDLV